MEENWFVKKIYQAHVEENQQTIKWSKNQFGYKNAKVQEMRQGVKDKGQWK